MKKASNLKLLVILGPTATGKSDLAVKLAKKYNGEIISADSRQVYKGLDIGTGKVTKSEMLGVSHHMLDVASTKKVFNVSDFQTQAKKLISEIISQGKLPILCGGTGFYIQSIVDGIVLPEVPPNKKLREKLSKKTPDELMKILKGLDRERADAVDPKNPVRLIRAIEIADALGKVPTLRQAQGKNSYEFLQIGLNLPEKVLKQKIHDRLNSRIKKGMIKETENLHKNGLSWKRMKQLGLEYRYLALYLQKKITKEEMLEKLEKEIWQYSKRQMTWFKRDKRIKWFQPTDFRKILKEVDKFVD